MEIFVGNLPSSTSVSDLRRLFGNAGNRARFRICQKKLSDGSVHCYGQAMVEPDNRAEELLHELQGATLHGRRLQVRRFVHRSYTNDRRARMWRGKPWFGVDRRKRDRRGS